MNAIHTYFKGWKWSIQNLKLWFWLYGINVALAALVVLPLQDVLVERLGYSMVSDRLMEGFDYTVFTDFINEYGLAITPILTQSKMVILLYFFLSIGLMGGILQCIKSSLERANFQNFMVGVLNYFWRIFFLTLIFLGLHLIVALGIFFLFKSSVHGFDFKQLDSELDIYNGLAIWGFVYALFLILIFQIQDYAKLFLVQTNCHVFRAIRQSFGFIFKNFRQTFLLTLLNWIGFILVLLLYWNWSGDDLNSTQGSLLFSFIFGQLFVFLRLGLKVVNLESGMLLLRKLTNKK